MPLINLIKHPSKLFHSSSMKDGLNRVDRHQQRLNTSMSNLLPQGPRTNSTPEQTLLQPPSDLSRSISNRSVTFATVFDDSLVETDPGVPSEEQDLVIIVPEKYVINEPKIAPPAAEPYPFRSEVPSHSSRCGNKKRFRALHSLHRSKKCLRPTKQSLNRSTLSLAAMPRQLSNDVKGQRSWRTVRRWMKSSSVGRLLQSVVKPPHTTRSEGQSKSPHPTISFPDLIY